MEFGVSVILVNVLTIALALFVLYLFWSLTANVQKIRQLLEELVEEQKGQQ